MADSIARSGPQILTTSAVTIYTAPSDAVIRTIQVANNSASARALTISIGTDSTSTRLVSGLVVPGNGTYTWTGFIPLSTGETIQAKADANSALALTAGIVEIA